MRKEFIKLKFFQKKKKSSQRWLTRNMNDDYIFKATFLGYRSRSAFKILEINKKYKIINEGDKIVDLGSYPGGWSQIILKVTGDKGMVFSVDIKKIIPLSNVNFIQGNFLEESIKKKLQDKVKGYVNVIVSDMSPDATGHINMDHFRIMNLVKTTFQFSKKTLIYNGNFCAKILIGGTEKYFVEELKRYFKKVYFFKPNSSRKNSSEIYIIGFGFILNNF